MIAIFGVVLVLLSSPATGARKKPACQGPLVANLPDTAFTASSFYRLCPPPNVRMATNDVCSAWRPGMGQSYYHWIKIDLGAVKLVKGIVTKGRREANRWVKDYRVAFKNPDTNKFESVLKTGTGKYKIAKVFTGNTDNNSKVTNMFEVPFKTRFVRVQPISWKGAPSMRVELLGC